MCDCRISGYENITQAVTKNVVNAARSTRRARMALSALSLKSFADRARFLLRRATHMVQTLIKCIGSIP